MHLILVHAGPEFPTYINDCIAAVRRVSVIPIHVLMEPVLVGRVTGAFSDVSVVALDTIPKDYFTGEYERICRLDTGFRDGFWKLTSLRFFYMYNYCRVNRLRDIFHIEYDNLIYVDFTAMLPAFQTRPMWCIQDAPQRCIASFMYFRGYDPLFDFLLSLMSAGARGENDMTALMNHVAANPEVGLLPIINHPNNGDRRYSENLSLFGALFDGAAVGQYVGGVDPRNAPGDTRGFINETTVFKCSEECLSWVSGRPYLNGLPLVNLHIHSKELSRWLSPSNNLSATMSMIEEYITGERIQSLCDVYCGLEEDFEYNRAAAWGREKRFDLSAPARPWSNPRRIFCYAHRLDYFRKWLPFLQNPFVLVTHNSDENITAACADILSHPLLVAMYSQNVLYNHPKLFCLPIGIANKMWAHGNLGALEAVRALKVAKTRGFYFYFAVGTNRAAREPCKASLERKGLRFGSSQPYNTFLADLAAHKFAICPAGNGIDSHRLWECLYLGVTPVVLRNAFTEIFAASFPCVVLDSWEDFDAERILGRWRPFELPTAAMMSHLAAGLFAERNIWCIHS